MEEYKKRLAQTLADTEALFFDENLVLKDGRPTPYFVNMAMFKTGRLCLEMGSFFVGMMVSQGLVKETDVILGPSYKGSSIALATALALHVNHGLDLLFDYDRKEAKVHGEGSKSASMLVNRTFFDGCRVFIVDDVATSMGTKYDLIERMKKETEAEKIDVNITGVGIVIDREQTTAVYDGQGKIIFDKKGEDAICSFVSNTGIPVYSVAGIREVVEYVYKTSIPVMINGKHASIDEKTKMQFNNYLKTYGITNKSAK